MREKLIFCRFIFLAAFLAGFAGHAEAEDRGETLESDEQLMQLLGPVVENEVYVRLRSADSKSTPAKFNVVQDTLRGDRIDEVWYDVRQTATDVFYTAHLMRAWSRDPLMDNLTHPSQDDWGVNSRLPEDKHPVDSENIEAWYHKMPGGNLKLVAYMTNAHGSYLVYPQGDIVDPAEVSAWGQSNYKYEWGVKLSPFFADDFLKSLFRTGAYAPAIGLRPLLASAIESHSLFRGGALNPNDRDAVARIRFGGIDVAVPRNADIDTDKTLNVPPRDTSQYRLRPLLQVINQMTFSPEIRNANPEHKAEPCRPLPSPIVVKGIPVRTPALPTHIDPRWYLSHYHPELLTHSPYNKSVYTSAEVKAYLDSPQADFFWVHPANNPPDCPGLDPARVFASYFPRTFSKLQSQTSYTRYKLIEEARSPEFSNP